MAATVLLMPGIHNSGPTHWQSLWEQSNTGFLRIAVDDWDRPVCAEWIAAIERAVGAAQEDVILVAHSLGCLAVAAWALQTPASRVRGVMLVALPDPEGPNFPHEAQGFLRLPMRPLPVASVMVSSADDPFGAQAYARRYAEAWGSRFVDIGKAGHINANSNLGVWDEGLKLLEELRMAHCR